ncbi:MAG: hypothetical protein CMK59_10375 [Proteobacteria bacterium]|nr:hypothetical protein [Pseudomonadota bacterium]
MQDVDLRRFFLLALPAMGAALLNNAYRIVDQFMIKWLGFEAQAAIGSSTFVLIAAYALFQISAGGVTPLFSQSIGAQNTKSIKQLGIDAINYSLFIGLVFSITLWFFSLEIAFSVGLEGQSAVLMSDYLFYLAPFGILFALGPTVDALFIASGNTIYPMKLEIISTILNIVLNWLLIYELQLGLPGAAIASGMSRFVSIVGLIRLIKDFDISVTVPKRIFDITMLGIPIMLGTLCFALVYFALLRWVVSPLGASANAALGIGFSAIEGACWPIYSGMMVALSSVIGRQIGAKRIDLCIKTIKMMFPTAAGIGLLLGMTMIIFAEPICTQFSLNPQTTEQAVSYCQIIGLSQCFVAVEALCEGFYIGSGRTMVLFLTSTPINILRIPVGWFLAHQCQWGVDGVWWAITTTTVLKTIIRSAMVVFILKDLTSKSQRKEQ